MLEELTFTSNRNTELEEFYAQYHAQYTQINQSLAQYKAQNDLLLGMLGEKSEELEALQQDIIDVKELYRSQLNDALYMITKENKDTGGNASVPSAINNS